ncbi:MAG: LysM peptidoglycan-binding domain-containing protein [Anaerolineae bacterium]|nr:LysM peptidoglycan-binding domain-containing protein [Anaerolineae bacterium]
MGVRSLRPSPGAGGRLALLGALAGILLLAGCGYVRVRVTASPSPPTPTPPLALVMPERRATSTPVPSTPLPTATPTATPTPVIHVVQQGDLLLHIASQYDVSMQAIIDANQIANPHSLTVGARLIIPRSEEELRALLPTATPTPMPLDVRGVGFYRTPVGGVWCMGEVGNPNDEALNLVQVQVVLYNADGEPLDRAAAFALADVVPGHGAAPFAVLLSRASAGGFASYEIEVLGAEPVTVWGNRHHTLSVENLAGSVEDGQYVAQGVVHNRGEDDAASVRAVITAYGEDGAVVAVRQFDVAPLAAGEIVPFAVTLIPAAPVVRLSAAAWGSKP